MSRLTIRIKGAQQVADELGATVDQVERAKKTALSRIATNVRRKLVAGIEAGTGLASDEIQRRIRIYNPNNRYDSARLIASSSGLPPELYPLQKTAGDTETRGRFSVAWFGGRKVGAGFVNMLGKQKTPLRTRSDRKRYLFSNRRASRALAPSVAAAAKLLINDPLIARAEMDLAKLFERALTRRVKKDDQSD